MGGDIFFFLGIKRSGNHAILNWLYKMIPNWVHLNNMPINIITSANYNANLTTSPLKQKYIDRRWIPHQQNNTLLISFEDQDIRMCSIAIEKFCRETGLTPKIIILTRSPQNNLASAYKVFQQNVGILAKYTGLWQRYTLEAIDNTIFKAQNLDIISVFYDKWFVDKEYRVQIANNMGLVFNDDNKATIFKHGTSSFDKMKFKDNAEKMDVLNRSSVFDEDENFKKFVNNIKTQEIWSRYKIANDWTLN